MKLNSPVDQLVRRQRRRARGTALAWALGAALAAHAWLGAIALGWLALSRWWALIPAVLATYLLVRWLRRARAITTPAVARELDARWSLHSRIETAVELAQDTSPMASAQRTDATERVAGREPTGAWAWRSGLALTVLALLLLSAEYGVVAARAWRAKAAVAKQEEKKAELAVKASITWKAPEDQIMASAVEEVPLTAYAESNTGFRKLTLEVEVNGKAMPSRPMEVSAFAKPGAGDVEVSLYLDELKVQAFDIVSYQIVGELATAKPVPPVSSPIQFIQVRPPRRDMEQKGQPGDPRLISAIRQMKAAEMRLLQQNNTLSYATDLKSAPTWKAENAHVAADQTALATKAREALDLAREANAPALVIGNLDAAGRQMQDAGESLTAEKNDAARAPQGRAIALLAEIEKLIGQAANGKAAPAASDPFRDQQKFDMPKREDTPAGQVEQLAQQQQQLNQQLSNEGQQGGGSEHAAEQEAIARAAEKLSQNTELDPSAQQALRDAASVANRSAQQLKADDRTAAREPAGAAQASLERALAATDQAGKASALATLDDVRRELNAASRASDSARSAALAQAKGELRAEAVRQQRAGSADAARQLANLADAVSAPKGKSPDVADSSPNTPERARELATSAARVQVTLGPRGTTLNRALRQVRRLPSAAGGDGAPGLDGQMLAEVELASQQAEWLTADEATRELAKALAAKADELQRAGSGNGGRAAAAQLADQLASALERARDLGQRDEIVRRFKAEDIDPAYRPAVEAYFERLSREGAKR